MTSPNIHTPLTTNEKQLVDVLLPHMTNRQTRRTLVERALFRCLVSLQHMTWNGNPYNVTVRLIRLRVYL